MIKVLMVDDHIMVREGIKRIIDDTNDIDIVAEAASGEEALKALNNIGVDIVLLDISMPGKNGIQTLKEIKKHNPTMKVLMLSMHAEEQYAMRAIKAGASGYLTKDSASDKLVTAIRKIEQGRKHISPEVAELLVTDIYHNEEKDLHSLLSDREFEILKCIIKGNSLKKIASNLSISDKTVSTYRSRLLKKLNLTNTADLIKYGINQNLLD